MKKIKRTLLILSLFILYIYISNISAIPDSIILFQGEELKLGTLFGIQVETKNENFDTVQASSQLEEKISNETGKVNLDLKIGDWKVKEVTVNVIPKTIVIPGGDTIGLKLYTNGVLVVGMSEITGEDQQKYKPYQNTGIEEGDMIIAVNNQAVTCTNDLITRVNACERETGQYQICQGRERRKHEYEPYKNREKRI